MLPFDAAQFEMVYCEGVIQHTRDSAATVAELCRVLQPGGQILATHYQRSKGLAGRSKQRFVQWLRKRFSKWERYKLLFITGVFAAAAHIPLIGKFVTLSGLAIRVSSTPEFKTTWTNTHDNLGSHAYQRYIAPAEFAGYFSRVRGVTPVYQEPGLIRGVKER